MAKEYNQKPSKIINIENDYIAYCFDEACIFLLSALKDGKKLKFDGDENQNKKPMKHFKSIREYYESLGVKVNAI